MNTRHAWLKTPGGGNTGLATENVLIRRNRRARRLILRIDPRLGPVLVMPPGAGSEEAEAFLARHRQWLAERCAEIDRQRIPLTDGVRIPYRDGALTLRHVRNQRRPAVMAGDTLRIGGDAAFFVRRCHDWLKAEARRHLKAEADTMARSVGRNIARLRITDTRSRWGSCSHRGVVSLSFRLILAPTAIARYVVAHEIAHLREMNHGPAFWRIVEELDPKWQEHRRWLRREGARLHLIG